MSGNQDGINVQWILTEFCKYSRPIRLYGYWVYSLILCNIAWCFIECISRNFRYCRYLFKMNNSCIQKLMATLLQYRDVYAFCNVHCAGLGRRCTTREQRLRRSTDGNSCVETHGKFCAKYRTNTMAFGEENAE